MTDQTSEADQSHLLSVWEMAMCSTLCMLSTFSPKCYRSRSLVGCKSFFVFVFLFFMTYNHNLPQQCTIKTQPSTPRPLHQKFPRCWLQHSTRRVMYPLLFCFISHVFFSVLAALFLRQTPIRRRRPLQSNAKKKKAQPKYLWPDAAPSTASTATNHQ